MRTNNLGTKKYNQASYTHTKVYNSNKTVKSILWLESLNIIIIKKKKSSWRSRLKNQTDMKNAIAGKYSLHINHACHLKNLSHKYGH